MNRVEIFYINSKKALLFLIPTKKPKQNKKNQPTKKTHAFLKRMAVWYLLVKLKLKAICGRWPSFITRVITSKNG